MICMSDHTDIGPVSITTDPEKFQQDLQELFVQVGSRMRSSILRHVVLRVCGPSHILGYFEDIFEKLEVSK